MGETGSRNKGRFYEINRGLGSQSSLIGGYFRLAQGRHFS